MRASEIKITQEREAHVDRGNEGNAKMADGKEVEREMQRSWNAWACMMGEGDDDGLMVVG
jgi:hypothetical protein